MLVSYVTFIPGIDTLEQLFDVKAACNESCDLKTSKFLGHLHKVRVICINGVPFMMEHDNNVIKLNDDEAVFSEQDDGLSVIDAYLTQEQLDTLLAEGILKNIGKGLLFVGKLPFKVIGWLWNLLAKGGHWIGQKLSNASSPEQNDFTTSYHSTSRPSSSSSSSSSQKELDLKDAKIKMGYSRLDARVRGELQDLQKFYPGLYDLVINVINNVNGFDFDRANSVMDDITCVLQNLNLLRSIADDSDVPEDIKSSVKEKLEKAKQAGWDSVSTAPNVCHISASSQPKIMIAIKKHD